MTTSAEDWDWLLSDDGQILLAAVEAEHAYPRDKDACADSQWLLVREQAELRQRALLKFPRAKEMLFSRLGLEQATDAAIACVKAARLNHYDRITDLCCGIGGDLIALGRSHPVVGLDYDPIMASLARWNAAAMGANVQVLVEDVANFDLRKVDAWHIDPDRRAANRRTTQIQYFSPPWTTIALLLNQNPQAAVKLAPATELDLPRDALNVPVLREWFGNRRECRQQVLWCGELAKTPPPNHRLEDSREGGAARHRATLAEHDAPPYSLEGWPNLPLDAAPQLGRYLYDPHATLLAARLLGSAGRLFNLSTVAPGSAYLTGDHSVDCPLLARFEILEHSGFDKKRWRRILRDRQIGELEIKKRGVALDPARLRRELKLNGDERGVLFVLRQDRRVAGVLARRC